MSAIDHSAPAERVQNTLGWLLAKLDDLRPDAQVQAVGTIERLSYLETLLRLKGDAAVEYVQGQIKQLEAGEGRG